MNRTCKHLGDYLSTHRLGGLFQQSHAKGYPGLPVVSLTMDRGLLLREDVDRRVETNLPPEGHRLVRNGELAYNMMRMWQGVCRLARFDCLISPAYVVLVPRPGIDPEFAEYFLRYEETVAEFRRLSFGVVDDRLRLYFGDFCRVEATIPSSETVQRKIAKILATVDNLIDRTEALIAKYQAIKQGMMHDLFTRGVDQHGHLRPTYDEAPELYKESELGWIPKEWDADSLGSIADLQVGYAFKSTWFRESGGTRLLRGENVGYGTPDWKDTQWLPAQFAESYREYLLSPGDVIIGMDRTFTKSGYKISQLREEDCPSLLVQRVGRFVPTNCDQRYLRVLLGYKRYHLDLMNQQKGMDIPHLSQSEILEPVVPVPPTSEQKHIAERLLKLESATEAEMESVNKLRTAKTGLMQDLLTGKVRVEVDEVEEAADDA